MKNSVKTQLISSILQTWYLVSRIVFDQKVKKKKKKNSTTWFPKISLKQRPYATFNAFHIRPASSTHQRIGLNRTGSFLCSDNTWLNKFQNVVQFTALLDSTSMVQSFSIFLNNLTYTKVGRKWQSQDIFWMFHQWNSIHHLKNYFHCSSWIIKGQLVYSSFQKRKSVCHSWADRSIEI